MVGLGLTLTWASPVSTVTRHWDVMLSGASGFHLRSRELSSAPAGVTNEKCVYISPIIKQKRFSSKIL